MGGTLTGISVLLIGGFDVGNQYFHFPTVIGAVISAAIVKLLQFLSLMWIIPEQNMYSLKMMNIIIM